MRHGSAVTYGRAFACLAAEAKPLASATSPDLAPLPASPTHHQPLSTCQRRLLNSASPSQPGLPRKFFPRCCSRRGPPGRQLQARLCAPGRATLRSVPPTAPLGAIDVTSDISAARWTHHPQPACIFRRRRARAGATRPSGCAPRALIGHISAEATWCATRWQQLHG